MRQPYVDPDILERFNELIVEARQELDYLDKNPGHFRDPVWPTRWATSCLNLLDRLSVSSDRFVKEFENYEPTNRDQVREAHKVASALNLTLVLAEVREADYERAFGKIVADQAQALLVLASPILNRDRKRIIDLAAKHRLPAVYQWRQYADEGGLMAYGSSITTLFSCVAVYVDRIFKGAKPSELPVEHPTSFELVVNMKTARALGLTLPPLLLVQRIALWSDDLFDGVDDPNPNSSMQPARYARARC